MSSNVVHGCRCAGVHSSSYCCSRLVPRLLLSSCLMTRPIVLFAVWIACFVLTGNAHIAKAVLSSHGEFRCAAACLWGAGGIGYWWWGSVGGVVPVSICVEHHVMCQSLCCFCMFDAPSDCGGVEELFWKMQQTELLFSSLFRCTCEGAAV
jgi:hypothetical protein